MNIKHELVLRVLGAFNQNGYADFIYENLSDVSKNDFFKTAFREMEDLELIKDVTKNGYAKRIKLNKILECPDFIWNVKIPITLKYYLLQCWDEVNSFGEIRNYNSTKDAKLKTIGLDRNDLINNAVIITKSISANCELVNTEFGYKLIIKSDKTLMPHKCVLCGETNAKNFNSGNKSMCKKCARKMSRNEISLEERIYKRAMKGAKSRNIDFELDVKYIKELLDNQNNTCFYSGVTFENNFNDKLTYPTLDRIDSSKGYVKGNVVLCTWIANTMKSDLTLKQFKDTIVKIYENKDNF